MKRKGCEDWNFEGERNIKTNVMEIKKNFMVVMHDNNRTIYFTDKLTTPDPNKRELPKFPDDARVVDLQQPPTKQDFVEKKGDSVILDMSKCNEFQKFLTKMFRTENAFAEQLGREYRYSNPVQY